MEEATFLTKMVSSIQVIHRKDELRASAALQDEAMADPKIKFNWNAVVTEILGNGKVVGVAMKDLKTGRRASWTSTGSSSQSGTSRTPSSSRASSS